MSMFTINYQACSQMKILALQSSMHKMSRQPAQDAYSGWKLGTFGEKWGNSDDMEQQQLFLLWDCYVLNTDVLLMRVE